MTKFHTVAITALLCSLLWIGGTALIIDEYIKVVQAKEFQIQMKDWDIGNKNNLINMYDKTLKDILVRCHSRDEIKIGKNTYVCFKIDKV
jgi:hypothetical protein